MNTITTQVPPNYQSQKNNNVKTVITIIITPIITLNHYPTPRDEGHYSLKHRAQKKDGHGAPASRRNLRGFHH